MNRPRTRAGLVLTLILLLSACQTPEPLHETLLMFGSEAEFSLVTDQPQQARLAIARINQTLSGYQRDWHPWQPGPMVDINQALARGESVIAPPSVIAVIERSRPFLTQTDGLFDPAVGGLLELWGFHTSTYPVTTPAPSLAQLEEWRAAAPSLDDVHIDGERIRSDNRFVQLDFGGIAEGIAAEEAARTFADFGLHNVLITFGGDTFALGRKGDQPWRVALRDPFGDVLGSVDLANHEALFSSGSYNKFRVSPSGARWPHVLDPRTGMPANGVATTVVLHPDPVLADVAATTLLIAGPARFVELAQRLHLGCVLLLTEQNELMLTTAMQKRVRLLRQPVMLGDPVDLGDTCAPRT